MLPPACAGCGDKRSLRRSLIRFVVFPYQCRLGALTYGQRRSSQRQPDEGIWEVRGGRQHFVHSKVMAWVAFDRAANELEAQTFNGAQERWRAIADEIHAEVCERGFDRELNSFVQAYGSKRLC
jgi:GH15 family glucan-1,4-alpha-glucosidase